jgi:hypothetical protein
MNLKYQGQGTPGVERSVNNNKKKKKGKRVDEMSFVCASKL